jgi:hypothetical protein
MITIEEPQAVLLNYHKPPSHQAAYFLGENKLEASVTLFKLQDQIKLPILSSTYRKKKPRHGHDIDEFAISVNRHLTSGQPRALSELRIPESYFKDGYDSIVHAFGGSVPKELAACHQTHSQLVSDLPVDLCVLIGDETRTYPLTEMSRFVKVRQMIQFNWFEQDERQFIRLIYEKRPLPGSIEEPIDLNGLITSHELLTQIISLCSEDSLNQ